MKRAIVVPARELGHDLDAMRAAIAADTRLVFIANPNNPTGTWLRPQDVLAFVAAVPRDVVVVLDEAYNEYLEPSDRADSVSWIAAHPNLIVSRTFSKAHGLAALRVGYKSGYDSQGFSVGAGLHWQQVTFDYAFLAVDNDLGSAHRLGLTLDL